MLSPLCPFQTDEKQILVLLITSFAVIQTHTHTFIRLLEKQGANKQACIELHWVFSFGNISGKINSKHVIWSAPCLIPLSLSPGKEIIGGGTTANSSYLMYTT